MVHPLILLGFTLCIMLRMFLITGQQVNKRIMQSIILDDVSSLILSTKQLEIN